MGFLRGGFFGGGGGAGVVDQTARDDATQALADAATALARIGPTEMVFHRGALQYQNMPAGAGEYIASTLTYRIVGNPWALYRQVRAVGFVAVVGAAGAIINTEYTVNGGGAWASLTTDNLSLASTGAIVGAWTDIPAALLAGADTTATMVRIVGSGGDGAADPMMGLTLEARY